MCQYIMLVARGPRRVESHFERKLLETFSESWIQLKPGSGTSDDGQLCSRSRYVSTCKFDAIDLPSLVVKTPRLL